MGIVKLPPDPSGIYEIVVMILSIQWSQYFLTEAVKCDQRRQVFYEKTKGRREGSLQLQDQVLLGYEELISQIIWWTLKQM